MSDEIPERDASPRDDRAVVARAQQAVTAAAQRIVFEFRQSRDSLQSDQTRRRLTAFMSRVTSHLAIIFVSIVAISLAGLRFGSAGVGTADVGEQQRGSLGRSPTVLVRADTTGSPFGTGLQQAGASVTDGAIIVRDAAVELPAAVSGDPAAPGAVPEKPVEKRTQITTYRVQPGDVIETIARRFGLQPTTVVWANQAIEDNPDLLRVGQELTILPVDGVYYTVKSGDSIAAIAKRFKAEEGDILGESLNDLGDGSNLIAGVQIIVPNGVKPSAARPAVAAAPAASSRRLANPAGVSAGAGSATGAFSWPTQGSITQGFWSYHRGLDIANSIGTPIYASDGGYVSYAGWSNVGYGYMVSVEHGNGFSTLYAHMSYYYVDAGQYVAKGQVLGLMGSTGNSTGPHLHFEIRYGGATQNPYSYLP